jgi:hypothetical protein
MLDARMTEEPPDAAAQLGSSRSAGGCGDSSHSWIRSTRSPTSSAARPRPTAAVQERPGRVQEQGPVCNHYGPWRVRGPRRTPNASEPLRPDTGQRREPYRDHAGNLLALEAACQVDVVPYFPIATADSYQPVTAGYAINSLGKAKWSLSCAHAMNTYMHVMLPGTVLLDPACS